MKLIKTGVSFLLLVGLSVTGCAIKTCPTYSKVPADIHLEKVKSDNKLEVKV